MSLLLRSARMKPELLEELQLTKESEAKQLHWGAGPRDTQRQTEAFTETAGVEGVPQHPCGLEGQAASSLSSRQNK